MNNKKLPAHQLDIDAPDQLRLAVGAAEEEIGARLRHQRLKRKVSIADAARALKLSPATLEDIERGNLGRLESLYRRGYLRNYARFLGLDPAPLLEMLQGSDLPPLRSALPLQPRRPNIEKYLKIATYAIVTTLIIPPLVLIYIQGGLDFLDRDKALAINADEAPFSRHSALREQGADNRLATLEPVRDQSSAGPVTASALPLSYSRPVRDPVAEERAALEAEAQSPGADTLDLRSVLAIEVIDDSWLEVYGGGGERLEFDLLRAGDQRRYLAQAPFRVLLGRASAVHLEFDGEVVTFEGQDRADVVSLELSADGVLLR